MIIFGIGLIIVGFTLGSVIWGILGGFVLGYGLCGVMDEKEEEEK